MKIDSAKLKEILVKESYVSKEDMDKALKYAKTNDSTIADYLFSQDILTKDLLGQAVAESFGVPYSDLNSNQPTQKQVLKIPETVGSKFRVVLFKDEKSGAIVATDNPKQKLLSAELKKVFKTKKVKITYSLPGDIDTAFVHYQKPLETRFSKIIKGNRHIAPEILEEIFEDAFTFQASDIHFEPQPEEVIVRFRVDGVLREAGRIPGEFYENILNRIKVQSLLRIDEHFAAQDGSMHHEKDNVVFDLRTSIVPTIEGEKIVLRVLAAYIKGLTLTDLGLTAENQKVLEAAAKKPFGMILVTGPTGSGKTTTLYAVLKILHRPEVNITTIEDPVEYKVLGINQIQVNNQTGLTFAKGLRSVVRQDPDIILVGEIRDEETAEVAVNAALTGHLLLSTFHANDAATSIPRLLDMNIEPFLLSSTLEVIIAQRLVRKLCEMCRYSVTVSQKELKKKYPQAAKYFKGKNVTLYAGKGCESCNSSGYKGRTAIFEFVNVSANLQDLILKNPSTKEIWSVAEKEGAKSLFDDGIGKVKDGTTTLEELLRVATPPKTS